LIRHCRSEDRRIVLFPGTRSVFDLHDWRGTGSLRPGREIHELYRVPCGEIVRAALFGPMIGIVGVVGCYLVGIGDG